MEPRTPAQLIRLAIGDREARELQPSRTDRSGDFEVHFVELPLEDFRGFPTAWAFATLMRRQFVDGKAASQIVDRARALAEEFAKPSGVFSDWRDECLAIISDDPLVRLNDVFRLDATKRRVFGIDHDNLHEPGEQPRRAQECPLVLAVRRGLPANAPAAAFAPYVRNLPVEGWRFYGRERELKRLVESNENIVIIGARRIGKTSILLETRRRLKENNENVYFVGCENLQTIGDCVGELLHEIGDARARRALHRKNYLNDEALSAILRPLAHSGTRTTIIFDEIGNALKKKSMEGWAEWNHFGILRKFSQRSNLRLIMSCFNEEFFRAQSDYESPFANLASTLRLGSFTDSEVEEFVLSPLVFWSHPGEPEKRRLTKTILSRVGRQPLLLQYFCRALFESIRHNGTASLSTQAAEILENKDLLRSCFQDVFDQVFNNCPRALSPYLFVRKCDEEFQNDPSLRGAVVDDDWLVATLADLGFKATSRDRSNILSSLELYGFTSAQQHNRWRQMVSAPVLYHYVRRFESPAELLRRLRDDIVEEAAVWGLQPLHRAPASS